MVSKWPASPPPDLLHASRTQSRIDTPPLSLLLLFRPPHTHSCLSLILPLSQQPTHLDTSTRHRPRHTHSRTHTLSPRTLYLDLPIPHHRLAHYTPRRHVFQQGYGWPRVGRICRRPPLTAHDACFLGSGQGFGTSISTQQKV